MKILLVANKTIGGKPDSISWYFADPMKSLGHEVYFYDTVGGDPSGTFTSVLENFKPDLIFCITTGNQNMTPYEPWEELLKETKSGRTKTFNWFCDDTWRFDSFSSKACENFTVCSTPERSHLQKYKEIGYDNIILANWHAPSEYFPSVKFQDKKFETTFIGRLSQQRIKFLEKTKVKIQVIHNLTQEQMFHAFSNTKIGINLSVNYNDPELKTQMKQRIFETTAGAGLLVTEYHPGIEEYFEIDKEIITFETTEEFREKVTFLQNKPQIAEKLAKAGHERFLKEHDSKIRLSRVLEEIMGI